jgi:glycerate-2-kinase
VSVGAAAPSARAELEALFAAALRAVDPEAAVRRAVAREGRELRILDEPVAPGVRLRVLAAGKAAAPMAAALEAAAGERIVAGLALVPDGYGQALGRIELREASHPLPDARGEAAARAFLRIAGEGRPDEILVLLLSGGASALLPCPAPGLTLEDLVATTRLLLLSGAGIEELNTVRKHLGALAGGRLAVAARAARIFVLAISDVPGDRLEVIGSGPCAPDPTRFADALEALDRYALRARLPRAVRAHLEAGVRGEREETPKPGASALARVRSAVLASNATALAGVGEEARRRGLRPRLLPGFLRGEARVAGRRLAALAAATRRPAATLLVAGGETTVTVRGPGRGGRNMELALSAALALEERRDVALLAAGTDGADGPTDAAGAFVDGASVARGRALGLEARAALERNDSYGFFSREGGLVRTGPTRTNVMDLALLRL